MNEDEQLPLSEEPTTPTDEPTLAEKLNEAAGERLLTEVGKTTINAASVATIEALVAVYQTSRNVVREESWDKNVIAVPQQVPGGVEVETGTDTVTEAAEAEDDAVEAEAEAPKSKKKKDKTKKKGA